MGKVVILVFTFGILLVGLPRPVFAGATMAPIYKPTPLVTAAPKPAAEVPIKELPQTGLPLAGSLIVALTPLGWKLRKYGQGKLNPTLVWQERELKK